MGRTCGQIIWLLLCAMLSGCGNSSLVKKNDLLKLRADADAAYMAGDWNKAEQRFRSLTQRVPGEGEFWFRLGNIYARTHRPEDAVAAYKEALLRQNVNSKTWHNMGIVHIRQAGNAFTQLLQTLDAQDPLFPRALAINEAILKLLNDGDSPVKPVGMPE